MGDHLKQRGLEAEIHGLPPEKSIDLEMYKGQHIPTNWDIIGVTGDILMCEYADEELLIHHVKERDIQYVSGVYEAIDLLEEKTGNYIVIPKIGTIKEAIQDLISKY